MGSTTPCRQPPPPPPPLDKHIDAEISAKAIALQIWGNDQTCTTGEMMHQIQ